MVKFDFFLILQAEGSLSPTERIKLEIFSSTIGNSTTKKSSWNGVSVDLTADEEADTTKSASATSTSASHGVVPVKSEPPAALTVDSISQQAVAQPPPLVQLGEKVFIYT